MILGYAKIRCFGIKNGKRIELEKVYNGFTIDQLVEKAKKLFEAFLIIKDVSEYEYQKRKYDFGVYISDGKPYGKDEYSFLISLINF